MPKTLYFEGAGCVPRGEVTNCRIRTAFTNREGARYYLEIIGFTPSKEWRKINTEFASFPDVAHIDFCHEITGSHEDCNERRHPTERTHHFAYTYAGILNYVNTALAGGFERVAIAPDLAGYHVHAGFDKYNYGDEFEIDELTTQRAEQIEREHYQKQKNAGEKYPCVSVWRDEDDHNILHVHHSRRGFGDYTYNLKSDDWATPKEV